jgi:hypothetical protein
VTGLVDRMLRDEGPAWVADLIDAHPEAVRTWTNDGHGRAFFDIHRLGAYLTARRVRVPQGGFDGKPGAPGALMARTAFQIARAMARHDDPEVPDAVVLVWDMDQQGEARRKGLAQARAEAEPWKLFRIVLGCPDMEREAWVLAGFEPENETERGRLAEERRALGFCPCAEAHRLRDNDDRALRSPKRALRDLTGDDREREARAWTDAPFDRLESRGAGSGLTGFLDEVRKHLVDLCNASR